MLAAEMLGTLGAVTFGAAETEGAWIVFTLGKNGMAL